VLGTDSGFASSSETNSASWSFEDDVEVHTEDTGEWIILNTQIDVFLDTEAETSSVWEVGFSQFSILNFEASFQNFVSLVASNGNMGSDFLVSFDTEASDGVSGSWWDGFLSGQVFEDLGCFSKLVAWFADTDVQDELLDSDLSHRVLFFDFSHIFDFIDFLLY